MAICTDGEASLTGKHSEIVAHVKELVPNIIQTRCMMHREALTAKTFGTINVGSLRLYVSKL